MGVSEASELPELLAFLDEQLMNARMRIATRPQLETAIATFEGIERDTADTEHSELIREKCRAIVRSVQVRLERGDYAP